MERGRANLKQIRLKQAVGWEWGQGRQDWKVENGCEGREEIARGAHAGRGGFGNSPLMVAIVVRERGVAKWEGVDH